jgi:hypothetical protein
VELNNYCSLPTAGIIRTIRQQGFNDLCSEQEVLKELIAYFPLIRRRRGGSISKQINALRTNKNVLARDSSNLPLCYAVSCHGFRNHGRDKQTHGHQGDLLSNVPSTPGMEVRKPWCLLSRNWVSLDNTPLEGGAIFEKDP